MQKCKKKKNCARVRSITEYATCICMQIAIERDYYTASEHVKWYTICLTDFSGYFVFSAMLVCLSPSITCTHTHTFWPLETIMAFAIVYKQNNFFPIFFFLSSGTIQNSCRIHAYACAVKTSVKHINSPLKSKKFIL